MTVPADLEALIEQVKELANAVHMMQAILYPVDASGLPVPTRHEHRDQTNIPGLRWQIGKVATVIVEDDPDCAESIFLRDWYGQMSGDVSTLTPTVAIQLAGALLAAARHTQDDLASRRRGLNRPRNGEMLRRPTSPNLETTP